MTTSDSMQTLSVGVEPGAPQANPCIPLAEGSKAHVPEPTLEPPKSGLLGWQLYIQEKSTGDFKAQRGFSTLEVQ